MSVSHPLPLGARAVTLPSTPWVTLDEIKAWLGIELTDTTQDTKLLQLRDTVTESIVDYTGQQFEIDTYTGELLDGRRGDILLTENWPIVTVTELVVGCLPDGSGGSVVPPDAYDVREDEIALISGVFPRGRGLIKVSYTAGYPSVPSKVKTALLLGVQGYFNVQTKNLVGITTRSKEGESVSYAGAWNKTYGLPNDSIGLLTEYREMGWGERSTMAIRNT